MKSRVVVLTSIFLLYLSFYSSAQLSVNKVGPGIWQTFGDPLNAGTYPEVKGRLCNFRWADLEISDNKWSWTDFDNALTDRTKDKLPVIFMVYTKEDAPDWIFDKGVPKVTEKDNKGNVTGYSPYYADPTYKSLFKRMIQKVHAHVETLPASVRNYIVGVQGCFGSTGDYIDYKGNVAPQYELTGYDFGALFQEFTQYYYDEYKNTNPKIYLLSNPRNEGQDQAEWVVQNCPGWLKTGSIGKGYQLNDESDKMLWLYDILNNKTNGDYIRARSEMLGGNLASPWWNDVPYQNMFAVMCYDIFWGLDWNNQAYAQINDHLNDSAFSFYAKYAGQKDAASSTNAMCALKDVLDAADETRFPSSKFGTVSRTNQQRYINIANKYAAYGAREEDAKSATGNELDNVGAKGINDVGWGLVTSNYDRYLHQLIANATSAGYWNISSAEANSMYGRFGRGFDVANGKTGLYFDLDDKFLNNAPLNGKYSVTIEITYLDKGTGKWKIFCDLQSGANKRVRTVNCKNTNKWVKTKITINNAYFGNRGKNSSDFSIRSANNENVIFSVVELSRPPGFSSRNTAMATTTASSSQAVIATKAQEIFQLAVAPNPVHEQCTVTAPEALKTIVVYDMSGKPVMQKNVSANQVIIHKTDLGNTTGTYFIKAFSDHKIYTAKILVL